MKIRIIENLAEDALRRQVLHEHLLHSFDGEIGIDRLPAHLVGPVEALQKRGIPEPLFLNLLLDRFGNLRNVVLEFGD